MKDIIVQRNVEKASVPVRIIKVPGVLYQIFYDWAQQFQPEEAKQKIFRELTEWVHDRYPGHGIVSFEDYSRDDAEKVNQRLKAAGSPVRIEWGMYVVIAEGASMNMIGDVAGLLSELDEQIDNQ